MFWCRPTEQESLYKINLTAAAAGADIGYSADEDADSPEGSEAAGSDWRWQPVRAMATITTIVPIKCSGG